MNLSQVVYMVGYIGVMEMQGRILIEYKAEERKYRVYGRRFDIDVCSMQNNSWEKIPTVIL